MILNKILDVINNITILYLFFDYKMTTVNFLHTLTNSIFNLKYILSEFMYRYLKQDIFFNLTHNIKNSWDLIVFEISSSSTSYLKNPQFLKKIIQLGLLRNFLYKQKSILNQNIKKKLTIKYHF